MNYQKVKIKITPFQEWLRDVLSAQLAEIGFDSFIETEDGLEAFVPESLYDESNMLAILDNYSDNFEFETEAELIPEQNWNEVWEKNYFQPLLIGDCLIRAPFHSDYPSAKYEIVIEPNMAFGTGNHETTSSIIEQILITDLADKKVLDMGCGTGILAILASMKGAREITAIDIDKWAYEATVENAQINNCPNIKAFQGDASLLGNESFDVIFANIHKNVLLNDMPAYCQVLKPGGNLIMSGFYQHDIPDIKEKAEQLGLKDAGYVEKNKWVAYSFTK